MFVKICGITSSTDALLAVALGADALGFVFAASPRRVSEATVSSILAQLPSEVLTFGVFNNEHPSRVIETVHSLGLSGAQVHGDVGHDGVDEIATHIRRTIRAYRAGHVRSDEFHTTKPWAILLDSQSPGSGEVFDWSLVERVPERARMILAGGLRPENIEEAIRTVRPFGVDVSTGVEASPGKKDPVKLRAFISNARTAFAQLAPSELQPENYDDDQPFNWELNR
jgi:phosphoribosylanthranilate isomerase